jgi:LuxR family maltose regulon positive regulatory protein
METHSAELFSLGRFVTVRDWVQPLPEGFLTQHPRLAMTCAWAELVRDNPAGASRYVQAASASLSAYQHGPIGTAERMMFGQMSLLQGCQYCREGKLAEAMASASEALASLLPGQVLYRTAAVCLGICHYVRGELEVAQPLLEANTGIAEARHNLIVPLFAVLALGRSHVLRGHLSIARQVYEKALQECIQLGWQDMPVCGILHIGLGEVAYQMDNLAVAEQHLLRGVDMTAAGGVQYVYAWGQVLLAQTRLAAGLTGLGFTPEQEAALMCYSGRFVVDIPPLSAALARLWLSQGRMDRVLHWLDVARLPADNQPAVEREAEYLVRARYLTVTRQMTKALELLERLTPSVENGKRHFVLLEILLLKTLILHGQGHHARARTELQHAVVLAEATRVVRLLIDEGPVLAMLLRKLADSSPPESYVHRLLDHFVAAGPHLTALAGAEAESLSKKEKQVAIYISKGLTSQEIAEVMFVARSTINSHIQSIYSKLGVNKRLQAIEKLRKLRLI